MMESLFVKKALKTDSDMPFYLASADIFMTAWHHTDLLFITFQCRREPVFLICLASFPGYRLDYNFKRAGIYFRLYRTRSDKRSFSIVRYYNTNQTPNGKIHMFNMKLQHSLFVLHCSMLKEGFI